MIFMVIQEKQAQESPKTKRARRRLESLFHEEEERITPEALAIEKKKIIRRIEGQKERIEIKELKSSSTLFDENAHPADSGETLDALQKELS